MIELRSASLADAGELARIHAGVWRHTYRDLAPEAAIRLLNEDRRRAFWVTLLQDPGPDTALIVATWDGAVAGFALGGPSTEAAFGGRPEVKYLYVDRAHARQGIGRRLLTALGAELFARGATGVGLGVVIGNDPAIAFYEAMGGRLHGRYVDPGPIWRSENLLYVWDDPACLLGRDAEAG
ncbi:GNAT family N-acetyltransferase [Azospirillum doebereinerae]|uniref:GNAT family N-acetyltransferase n=1 Tax=Azospirillum doebereinerae TaxID=92933 RepID=A0A433J8I2_9PROT|nr:GNAT family N-acetyltransferase [Azospirillum doebereinerae]RUQ70660.1 GNAT family N-acetyltransferase [Azospirillum doebereinerae]